MAIKLMPGEYNRVKVKGFGVEETGDSLFAGLEPKANLILIIAIILLVLTVLSWLGLWWYKNDLIDRKNILAGQIEILQSKRDAELEERLIELDKGIEALDKILKERIYPRNVLSVLEDLVLPEVVFSDFRADVLRAEVSFGVSALNYTKLAEQMVVFKEDSRIKSMDFSGINLNEDGGASSNFQIVLDADVLRSD